MKGNTKRLKNLFGLFGAGGHGRETMDQIKSLIQDKLIDLESENTFFVESKRQKDLINGISVLTKDEFIKLDAEKKMFNISISDHSERENFAKEFCSIGCEPLSVISKLSDIGNENIIGAGAIVSQFSIITTNVKIGNFFQLNRHASVSHDCIIGDYVTFAPYATCSGNVVIEDGAYIGAGAIIKQGSSMNPLTIGKNAIIGMGAIVTRDVEPNSTVIGNPAKLIKRK